MIRKYDIDSNDLRAYCVRRNFYTRGTNQQYAHLFDIASDYDGSIEQLEMIARDIAEHSFEDVLKEYCNNEKELISNIMTGIERYCVYIWYEEEE